MPEQFGTSTQHDRIEKMAEHVNYEMMMFRQSDQFLRRLEQDNSDSYRHLYNAVLNDYVVHLRCLYGFFYSTEKPIKNRPTKAAKDSARDCVAADFFLPESWEPPPAPTLLEERYAAMNRLLAHISYWRLDHKDGWCLHELSPAIAEIVNHFFRRLPDAKRLWFKESSHSEFWDDIELLRRESEIVSSPVTTVSEHRRRH